MMLYFHIKFVRDVIGSFKGDTGKLYSSFYKCVSDDIVFKNLTKVSLAFEVANPVIANLTKSKVKENVL